MNRKRTQKQIATYRGAALDILRRFGARVNEASSHMYVIDTRLGPLKLSVWDSMIPCQFDDVQRAKPELYRDVVDRLNPFSGKWNFNGGESHEGDMVDLAQFAHELRQILPEGYQPNHALPLVEYED